MSTDCRLELQARIAHDFQTFPISRDPNILNHQLRSELIRLSQDSEARDDDAESADRSTWYPIVNETIKNRAEPG